MNKESFFIGNDFERVPQEKLEALKAYGACIAADAMKGFNAMDGRIRTIQDGHTVCGCAVTVRLRQGDNLLLHRAIELARPGDVLVIDTCGDMRDAAFGGNMSLAAFSKGIAAMIVDGAVRDVEELRENGYAVFAAATISNTGDTEGPGMINQPISCGNVPVLPGDVILADDNGVTVVPQKWLDFVLEGCEKKQKADLHRAEEIRAGKLVADRLKEKLEKLGC